ncbi:MAG: hypothetical protein EOL95_03315 [Bacteroidia bacterium]|nr:hypothetical protein [Bacteroidia bacterium]
MAYAQDKSCISQKELLNSAKQYVLLHYQEFNQEKSQAVKGLSASDTLNVGLCLPLLTLQDPSIGKTHLLSDYDSIIDLLDFTSFNCNAKCVFVERSANEYISKYDFSDISLHADNGKRTICLMPPEDLPWDQEGTRPEPNFDYNAMKLYVFDHPDACVFILYGLDYGIWSIRQNNIYKLLFNTTKSGTIIVQETNGEVYYKQNILQKYTIQIIKESISGFSLSTYLSKKKKNGCDRKK